MRHKTKEAGPIIENRKRFDIPKITPLKLVLSRVENTNVKHIKSAISLIDSQILARKVELMSIGCKEIARTDKTIEIVIPAERYKKTKNTKELERIVGLAKEVAELTDKKTELKMVGEFVRGLSTN